MKSVGDNTTPSRYVFIGNITDISMSLIKSLFHPPVIIVLISGDVISLYEFSADTGWGLLTFYLIFSDKEVSLKRLI